MLLTPIVWALAVSLGASPAARPEVLACIGASTHGQELRDKGELLAARMQFRNCAAEGCPKPIRGDCTRWLADVEQAIPSISIAVREGSEEVAGVELAVDDVPVSNDGRTVEVDPGRHAISATRGAVRRRESIVVVAGEKNRLVVVGWETPKPTPAPVVVTAPPEASVVVAPAPAPTPASPSPAGPLTLSVVAVVGVAAFVAVGTWGQNDLHQLEASPCGQARTCPPGSTDGVRAKYVAADVGLGVGIAAAAVAAVWNLAGRF